MDPNIGMIADINFGLSKMIKVNYLERLSKIRQEHVMNNIRIERTKDESQIGKLELAQMKLQDRFAKMFDEYKEKCVNNSGENVEKDEQGFRFAYVTFRHMDAMDLVLNSYKYGKCEKCCAMSCFGSMCCK